MKKIKLMLLLIIALVTCGCINSKNSIGNNIADVGNRVHFIDVDQGDSILVESDGEYMLVDAGEENKGDVVVDYINSLGISCLKYAVATHPHSDHIGGMDDVINNIDVQNIIMPDAITTTKCFENMLDAAENKNVNVIEAIAGNSFELGNFNCTIVGPINESEDMNNNSVVIKLTYGEDKILLTGDCSKAEERDIVNSGADISADLLKAGHHGSSTSGTEEFIKSVNPGAAVISCGRDNDYGHPHKETMDTFNKHNIEVYRTDTMGTIVADCSGNGISIKSENKTEMVAENEDNKNYDIENKYILNTRSKKFHKPDCGSANNIKDKEEYTGSAEELKSMGYSPCGTCKPE